MLIRRHIAGSRENINMTDRTAASTRITAELLFRLLPVQILLNAVGSVNGIVSGYFAGNYVGIRAMSAVGLYGPVGMLAASVSTVLVSGSAILCGRYMGQNEQEKMQNVFSLNLLLSLLISFVFIAVFFVLSVTDLTVIFTQDNTVRPLFNRYLLGQAAGIIPMMLGNSFASFLSMENRGRRTFAASLIYIAFNIILNWLFVRILHMEALGLALASSLGMWIFLAVQASYFLSGKSHFRIFSGFANPRETGEILRIGLPGALGNIYQTARGLIINHLLEVFVGTVGISAFAAANNLMGIFWSVPAGMLAVSRMCISVSAGEEDRQTLTDIFRVMFTRFIPLMLCICALIIFCAVPMTWLFYKDPASPVFSMTVRGLRILPLCMPFAIIVMHYTCWGQTSGKQILVHLLALLDGVVCAAGFTALLIPFTGMDSVYYANVLNGIVTVLVIIGYACLKNRHLPGSLDELLVFPPGFGVSADDRLDVSVRSMDDVMLVAGKIEEFCTERGVSKRNAVLAGLCMEEMAGNIVEHGFTKDRKPHSADVRVVYKNGDIILRIRDDCVPFDPDERRRITDPDDPSANTGIRMIFGMAREVKYQNILGLNVLTIRI